jgi:hypothetical protein
VSGPTPGVAQTFGGAANIAEIMAAAGTGGMWGAPVGNAGLVYMGPSYAEKRVPRPGEIIGSTYDGIDRNTALTTVDLAKTLWIDLDDDERNQWFEVSSQKLGYDTRTNVNAAFYEYTSSIDAVAAYQKETGRLITPIEYARQMASFAVPKPGGGGSGSSTVVNLTNPDDAKVFVDNALKTYLGRAATQEESDTFLSTLNKVERQNPIRSTPSSRSGGTNPQLVAQEFGRAQEGAAEFLAATQYTDWMMESVRSDVTEGLASGL